MLLKSKSHPKESKPLTSEQLHIQKLEHQLLFWHYLILFLFLIALLVLSLDNHLFENIILLPLFGAMGYLLIRKMGIVTATATLCLMLAKLLKDLISPSTDTLINYLFYLFLCFSLTLAGSLCGYFLLKSFHQYSQASKKQKILFHCFWLILTLMALAIPVNLFFLSGNPISSYHAQYCMQHYLKETYPEYTAELSKTKYDPKSHTYSAKASLYAADNKLQIFNIAWRKGHITEDYFETYLEDLPAEYRLNHQVTEELKKLLEENHLDCSEIDCQLQLPQGKYTRTIFDKASFDQPLPLSFKLVTRKKQTYEAFASWCESIRSLLTDSGYQLSYISFESSPHWEENRLQLILKDEELNVPITDVTTYKHFEDYGVTHQIQPDQNNPEPYYDYYPNEDLNALLEERLGQLGITPLYVSASNTSVSDLMVDFCWTGRRISVDHFAESVMEMLGVLEKEKLLAQYSLQSLSFTYYWGTTSEGYEYTVYPENIDDQSTDRIIDTLLDGRTE